MSEWIEHRGDGCPYRLGQIIDVVTNDGIKRIAHPVQTPDDADPRSPWRYNQERLEYVSGLVLRHRLHDNGEQAKREARIEMLRKMAQPNDYDVKRVTTPEREKVKQ